MATKTSILSHAEDPCEVSECTTGPDKINISAQMFNVSMLVVIATVVSLIYTGGFNPETSRGVRMTASFKTCLDGATVAPEAVDEIEEWIDLRPQQINNFDEVVARWLMLSEVLEQKDNMLSMVAVVSVRGEWSTYFSVINCASAPFSTTAYCHESGTPYITELWSLRLNGDMLMRRYAFDPTGGRDEMVYWKLLHTEARPTDPRMQWWYSEAIAGTRDGQWQQYIADKTLHVPAAITSFSRTFRHNKGTSVIPGEPGGGVIMAAAHAARLGCRPSM